MEAKKRNIIIISSSLAVVVTIVVIYFVMKRKSELKKEAEAKAIEEAKAVAVANDPYIRPKRDRNGALTNPISELMGKQLIAKSNGTRLRTTPWINNATALVSWDNNVLATAKQGQVLGTVVGIAKGKETPAMNWYRIKLLKPIKKGSTNPYDFMGVEAGFTIASAAFSDQAVGNIQTTYQFAYVRSDVADFKPYKK